MTTGEAIKVGYSGAPIERLKHIEAAGYKPVKMLANFPGSTDDEAAVLAKFKDLNIRGEWFTHDQSILDFIGLLEQFRGRLNMHRVTIQEVVSGTAVAEIKPVPFPREAASFTTWADRECGKWPETLQIKAARASYFLRGLRGTSAASVEEFADAYSEWAAI